MASSRQPLHVELELNECVPPAGWLLVDGCSRQSFGGWLELIGLLESVLRGEDR